MREIYWNLLTWEIYKVLHGGTPDGFIATDETGARFVVYFHAPRAGMSQ